MITLKEYIEELQKLPQDLPVCIHDTEFGLCEAALPMTMIQHKEEGDAETDLPFPVGTRYISLEVGTLVEQPRPKLKQACQYCGYEEEAEDLTYCKKCDWKPMLQYQLPSWVTEQSTGL